VSSTTALVVVAGIVAGLNVPFGWWRAGTRKLSLPWFLAVHAPVPLVVATRLAAGVRWQLATLPVLVGSYALGQWAGGRLRRRRDARRGAPVPAPQAGAGTEDGAAGPLSRRT